MKGGPELQSEVVRLNTTFDLLMNVMNTDKEGSGPSAERQHLMRNMGVNDVVMDFIRESSYIVAKHVEEEKALVKRDKSIIKSKKQFTSYVIIESGIFQQAYRLLELFCCNNIKHQMLLHAHLEQFSTQLGAAQSRRISSLGQNHLIAAIFHSNKQLCNAVSPELIQTVAKQIITCGALADFLSIPRAVVMCNGVHIRANQDMIMHYIVGSANENGDVGEHLGLQILKSVPSKTKWTSKEQAQQMQYEAALCDLLAECCIENVMAQLKTQALLPLDIICMNLCHPNVSGVAVQLRAALLKILYCVYLENDTIANMQSPQLQELWTVQKEDILSLALSISAGKWVAANETEFIKDFSVRDCRPHEKKAWAKIECFFNSFLPVLHKMLTIWEIELRESTCDSNSFTAFVQDIVRTLHDVVCGNEWVLPFVVAHDAAHAEDNKLRCCSVHTTFFPRYFLPPNPIAYFPQMSNLSAIVGTVFVMCGDEHFLDRKHRTLVEILKNSLERSILAASEAVSFGSEKSTVIHQDPRPELVTWFENSLSAVKEGAVWKEHETAEFNFLITSVCLSQVICEDFDSSKDGAQQFTGSRTNMRSVVDYLIEFLYEDTAIERWTSISCLRLVEGIVLSDFSELEKANHGVTQEQQRKLTALCFDILRNRLGGDSIYERAGYPTNSEVLNHVLGLANALLSGKKGGNTFVQTTVYEHLNAKGNKSSEENFVMACKKFLKRSMKELVRSHKAYLDNEIMGMQAFQKANSSKYDLNITDKTLRLLQLLCEGHYKNNQNYLRDQGTHRQVDLVGEVTDYFGILWSYHSDPAQTPVMLQTLDTLAEFVQGPCIDNQDSIVTHGFLSVAMSVLSDFGQKGFSLEVQESIKNKVVITMQVCAKYYLLGPIGSLTIDVVGSSGMQE